MSALEPVFLNDWAAEFNPNEFGIDALKNDFGLSDEVLIGVRVIVADYTYEDYSGSAYVLFERDGQLYEVHGGHCSCYGLEGQWEPEVVTIDDLRATVARSPYYLGDAQKHVEAFLHATTGETRP